MCETDAGSPAALIPVTHAFTGSVVKYALGPPGITGTSTGCEPALSGIRASIRLIATRSGVTSGRPPACPTQITSSGRYSSIASRRVTSEREKTHGSSTATVSCRRPVSRETACHDGFTRSPPNGSKPVRSTDVMPSP